DFTKGRLSLSSVALASSWAGLSLSAADKHLDERLPEPTTQREFSSEEELTVYAEPYDNQPAPAHKVAVSSTIRSDAGQIVLTDMVERSSDDLKTARGVSTRIPLKTLRPGLYVLTVEEQPQPGSASTRGDRAGVRGDHTSCRV